MTHTISYRTTLPHDVLRLIFEYAANEDRRTALRLVVVSHLVQRWVELILYSVVNLHRETTSRAFLRTIETSQTKSRTFFATHVKSLCISYDFYNDRTVRIISACRGVTSLTFWVVPSALQPTICLPPNEIAAALTPLRPKRLSVLLHDVFGSPKPRFQMSFFERTTHLSVINKWEDWTTWWGFDLLPCLTHLSFDLRIGPRPMDDQKALIVSHAINNILGRCAGLQVCMLLLVFDPMPAMTAAAISRTMASPDPRLVFFRDSEPFRDREAHSTKEADVWKRAEETVMRQRAYPGHVVLEI